MQVLSVESDHAIVKVKTKYSYFCGGKDNNQWEEISIPFAFPSAKLLLAPEFRNLIRLNL